MTQDPQVAQGVSESADDALIACLTEIERFVASSSWGGPPRLFALVRTVDLVKAEPALAGQLAIGSHDSLSSIEQDDFRPGEDLAQALATTTWGDAVDGAAICVERIFLPDDCADEIPHDPEKAAAFVAAHPKRQEVRVVAGALSYSLDSDLVCPRRVAMRLGLNSRPDPVRGAVSRPDRESALDERTGQANDSGRRLDHSAR